MDSEACPSGISRRGHKARLRVGHLLLSLAKARATFKTRVSVTKRGNALRCKHHAKHPERIPLNLRLKHEPPETAICAQTPKATGPPDMHWICMARSYALTSAHGSGRQPAAITTWLRVDGCGVHLRAFLSLSAAIFGLASAGVPKISAHRGVWDAKSCWLLLWGPAWTVGEVLPEGCNIFTV